MTDETPVRGWLTYGYVEVDEGGDATVTEGTLEISADAIFHLLDDIRPRTSP